MQHMITLLNNARLLLFFCLVREALGVVFFLTAFVDSFGLASKFRKD